MKITQSLQEFDSFDSYLIQVYQSGQHIAVPYANLGVGEHPINESGETAYIERAVLLARDISYLKVNGAVIFGEWDPFGEQIFRFGGYNLNGVDETQEFEFAGGEVAILLPDGVEIAESQFPRPDPADPAWQDHFFLELPEFPEIMEIKGWVPASFG